MTTFEAWLNTNGLTEEWHNTHNACDYAREAYLAGAEAMRERCAEMAKEMTNACWLNCSDYNVEDCTHKDHGFCIEDAIRKMEV